MVWFCVHSLQERGAADEAVIRDGNLAESGGDQAGLLTKLFYEQQIS